MVRAGRDIKVFVRRSRSANHSSVCRMYFYYMFLPPRGIPYNGLIAHWRLFFIGWQEVWNLLKLRSVPMLIWTLAPYHSSYHSSHAGSLICATWLYFFFFFSVVFFFFTFKIVEKQNHHIFNNPSGPCTWIMCQRCYCCIGLWLWLPTPFTFLWQLFRKQLKSYPPMPPDSCLAIFSDLHLSSNLLQFFLGEGISEGSLCWILRPVFMGNIWHNQSHY